MNIKKSLITPILLGLFTLSTHPVFAQKVSKPTGGITNPAIGDLGNNSVEAASGATFTSYFVRIWQAVITVGGLTVLLYFVWGGIEWITAGGDSSKIEKARNKITQSVIGMIILVGSFAIIGLINTLFFGNDFNLLNPTF